MSSSTLPRSNQKQRSVDQTSVEPTGGCRMLLVGPPGAGKSSQGPLVAERLDVPYISTGALLRAEVQSESRIGQRVADYMNMGRLVPEWLMTYALERRLSDATRSGFVLDGYPRTLEQAERFTESLDPARLDGVIELVVPDDVALLRLAMRRRADDDAQVARSRLDIYREETGPMRDFFASAGLLTPVDGSRPCDAVSSDLLALVDTIAANRA